MQYNKFVNILGRPIPQRRLPGRFSLKYFREVSTMVRKTEVAFVPNLRGGEGTVEIRHLLSKDELMGHASMYAHVIIPPHGSIGFHQHVENTEPYYVIKGKGIFEDNDHTETEIHPGDVCVIEVGQSNAIKNPFDEPLEFMALVINERGKEI